MKALVFILVLANVLFFAYAEGYFGRPGNPDAGRMQQQVNPEKIRVVARSEPPSGKNGEKRDAVEPEAHAADKGSTAAEAPAAPAPAPAVPPPAPASPAAPVPAASAAKESCLAWRGLPASDANRLGTLLAGKFSDFKVERHSQPAEGGSWWVFIPPLPNKAEVDRKVAELKRLGVTEYFVVQEAGPNHYAISLGVFSSEAGAGEQLATLKGKGVKSAKAAPRTSKDALQDITAKGPSTRRGALQTAAAAILPEKAVEGCKESP